MTHDLFRPGDARERKSAGHDLAVGREVGYDAVVFLGAAVGEPEPSHDLVEDERHAVALRRGAQSGQESRGRHDRPLVGARSAPRPARRGARAISASAVARSLYGAISTSASMACGTPAELHHRRREGLRERGTTLISA